LDYRVFMLLSFGDAMRNSLVILMLFAVVNVCGAADIDAFFGSEQKLRNLYRDAIIDADDSVCLAMDLLEDEWLIASLTDAEGRGREVRIILDPKFIGTPDGKVLVANLRSEGCEVVGGDSEEALVSRFVVIDGEKVIAGSYPFSKDAAYTSLTDALVITDKEIVNEYIEFFDYCWNTSK